MEYGYRGKVLVINLTDNSCYERELTEGLLKDYIGGRGLGSVLLSEYVPRRTDPLGPDNALMFLTGPVTGTLVPGSSKYVVVTKSPVSGGFCDSYSSGRLSIEIKASGYDGIIVLGKASKPSILLVENGQASVLEAEDLWGLDTFDAEDQLKKRYGEDVGVACIGPAGERLVKFASINSDYYRQAARGGVGAVMGSKMLKAVVAKGNMGVKCFNGNGLMQMIGQYRHQLDKSVHAQKRMKYGTPLTMNITNALGMLPTRNFKEGTFPEAIGEIDGDGFIKDVIRHRGCIGCLIACSKIAQVKEGEFAGDIVEGPEYETMALFGSNLGITNRGAIIRANVLCDRLGMDTISTGNVIGFAMECYEKGLITKNDCDGIELNFGNYGSMLKMIELIADRQGIGNVLAEGVRDAAREIGQGSQNWASHIKGLEFPAYEPRAGYGIALAYAVSPRGACHRRAWPPKIESLGAIPPDTVEGKAGIVKDMFDENCIFHSALICDFPCKMAPLEVRDVVEYLNAVTGMGFTEDGVMLVADRVETYIRLFNIREGLSRSDDDLPPRSYNERLMIAPDKEMTITKENMDYLLDDYYRLRGWDKCGIPTDGTLRRLGISGIPERP
jgi:aldehyde:ferredoxin oxidoreductase